MDVQVGDDGCLGQGDSSGGGTNWSEPTSTFQAEVTGFLDGKV